LTIISGKIRVLTFRSHFILVKILSDSRHGSLFPDLALLVIFLSALGGITPSPRAPPSYWRKNMATAPATTLFSNALKTRARSSASFQEQILLRVPIFCYLTTPNCVAMVAGIARTDQFSIDSMNKGLSTDFNGALVQ